MDLENVKEDMELICCLVGLPGPRLPIKSSAFSPKELYLITWLTHLKSHTYISRIISPTNLP